MATQTHLSKLQSLQEELTNLSKQSLPVHTRAVLDSVRQHISQLDQAFRADSRQERLGALYSVSRSLGISLNLDDVLTQVMDAVIQLTGAERGFLTLINPESGSLDLRAGRNIGQETLQRKDMEISRTVVQAVIESGEGVVTTDARTDPRFAEQDSVVIYALRSILCAPLKIRGAIIGVIYVDNRTQASLFTKEDLDLLSTFANQAAIVIENARLYTRTDQALNDRIDELETLSQIDIQLNENLDLGRVFEITRQWAIRGTDGIESWISLLNQDKDTQTLVAGPRNEGLFSPDDAILALISDDPNPQIIHGSENAPAYLLAPLMRAGKIIGGIIVGHSKDFSDHAAQFIGRLAARSAIAVENAQLYQAVQRANESKSQFVSTVTHELRIPLTSIKGYADLIQQGAVGPVSEQQTDFLNVIRNNVDRMAALISDLSDISRIERGILKLEPIFIQLNSHVDEAINSLQHKLEEKEQKLVIDVPKGLPRVYADSNRLIQVLTNLISNAWKYTDQGGQITICANTKNNMVCVQIIDTGIGISDEDQGKLFAQFFRSEASSVREQPGWGLGLNVTKHLVEVMGGEIGVISKLGKGSTFWFTIPTIEPVIE